MPVKPFAPRHYSEDIGSRLFITIPSRKNWFLIPFLGIWLAGWAFGEIMVRGIILGGVFGNGGFDGVPILFLLVWFTGWTIGGAFAIYAFLWQLIGREEIEITSYSITISQVVAMFRRSKEYVSAHIKELRTSPMGMNEMYKWSRSLAFYGIGGGIIIFDYGVGTIRLGSGIDEAEGKQVIAEIQQKYPQYKK
jgi:hypothetical protein